MEIIADIKMFIIEKFLFGEIIQLDKDKSFLEAGIIDSTGVLELLTYIEKRYCINIDDEEIIPENFDSLGKIEKYLIKKIKKTERIQNVLDGIH